MENINEKKFFIFSRIFVCDGIKNQLVQQF